MWMLFRFTFAPVIAPGEPLTLIETLSACWEAGSGVASGGASAFGDRAGAERCALDGNVVSARIEGTGMGFSPASCVSFAVRMGGMGGASLVVRVSCVVGDNHLMYSNPTPATAARPTMKAPKSPNDFKAKRDWHFCSVPTVATFHVDGSQRQLRTHTEAPSDRGWNRFYT